MLTVSVDTSAFQRSFREYLNHTKKELTEVINKKALIVAASAARFTRKANREAVQAELGKFVSVREMGKRGKMVNRRKVELVRRTNHPLPLIAEIINARRGRAGMPGLEGAEMESASRKLLAARLRSIGFAASGWNSAVKAMLGSVTDRSGVKLDRSAKVYGQLKGSASPARLSWNPEATIANTVSKGGSQLSAIIRMGAQQALDAEAKSMDEYVARKMQPHIDKFNAGH